MFDISSVLFFLIIILVIGIFFEYLRIREEKKSDFTLNLIKENIKEIQRELSESKEKNISLLQEQLKESSKIVREVTSELEKIHADHRHVINIKEQLEKLTETLANPKQRGILGEYFLDTLLKNVFSSGQYKLQYKFRNGTVVDAVIFIKDKIIPIDSKFSLENYNKILEEKDSLKREKLEKIFKQDLKTRIEETSKYIQPEENTVDFAFMFIPSEGIYYDLLINQVGGIKSNTYNLIEYAFKEKHVIPVSPTSFYAYLLTVLEGLRALEIEKSAKEIREKLRVFQRHLLNYNIFLEKLGNSLNTTLNFYTQSCKEFNKITKDVTEIVGKEKEIREIKE